MASRVYREFKRYCKEAGILLLVHYMEYGIKPQLLSSLIKKLLFFSKPLKSEKTYVNIHDLLSLNINRIKQAYPAYNIQVQTGFDNSMPKVFVDEESIDHVLINVLKNSVEASPENCKLIVQTNFLNSENKIEIKIRDFGIGISDEIKIRIFEPFFSKKN